VWHVKCATRWVRWCCAYLQVLVGCKRLNVLCLQELVVALHRQVLVGSVYYMAHCALCSSFCTGVRLLWMKRTGAATFLQTGASEKAVIAQKHCLKKGLTRLVCRLVRHGAACQWDMQHHVNID
jgi:hypothetical protein